MKKKFRLLSLLAAAAAVLIFATGCGKSSSSTSGSSQSAAIAKIKKSGKIRIAVFGDLPPYGWINKSGKRVGYDLAWPARLLRTWG